MDTLIYRHVFLIIVLYIGLFVSFHGWGYITSRILKLPSLGSNYFFVTWAGWSVVVFIFQFIHLFVKLDWLVSTSVYILGSLFSLIVIFKKTFDIKKIRQRLGTIKLAIYFSLMLVVACWLAFKGMGPAEAYDSGLYHFTTIRWINSFPIVPGLGNLHDRLAFNQSIFVYTASLNFYPYFPYARSISNSFLFLLVFAELVWQLFSPVQKKFSTGSNDNISYILYLSGLLFLTYLGFSSDGFTSPTSDLAISLIQLILFIWFAQIIINVRDGNSSNDEILTLILLTATSITIKLSNLVFALVLTGTCLAVVNKSIEKKDFIAKFTRVIILLSGILVIWVTRGVYLSGYPLFPSTFGRLAVNWAVPKDVAQTSANWIYSWARMPGEYPSNVLGNWNWLYPWFNKLGSAIIWLVCSALFLIAIAFIFAVFQKKLHALYRDFIFLIPIVASLGYWFFTAPDFRFANTSFFLLLLSAILICIPRFNEFAGHNLDRVIITSTFIIGMILTIRINYPSIRSDFSNKYATIQRITLIERKTDSGLTVYSPVNTDQCWDSPLPCTPYFNPKLELLIPSKMEAGFKMNQ